MRMVCVPHALEFLFVLFMHLIQSSVRLGTGNWRGAAEIPKGNLEDAETRLEGEDKVLYLKHRPEERSSAEELLDDAWLNRVPV
jgi:hypothetical protein